LKELAVYFYIPSRFLRKTEKLWEIGEFLKIRIPELKKGININRFITLRQKH